MDNRTVLGKENVTAVVPAYNEAGRIGRVLDVLVRCGFREVIVVDDGSTDGTGAVVKEYDVTYIRTGGNKGKGQALDAAVGRAETNLLFFSDADVENLTHEIVDTILAPVLEGKVEMSIGMSNRSVYVLQWVLAFVPPLGGERALTKELWQRLPDWYKQKFRIEAGLNFYAKYYGRGFVYKVFPELAHVVKEKKYGLFAGAKSRASMFYDVFVAGVKSELLYVPATVAHRRRLYVEVWSSAGGALFGALLIAAAYTGPVSFVLDLFSGELSEDPSAPLIYFLIGLIVQISAQALALFGLFVFMANAVVVYLRLRKIRVLKHEPAIF